MTMNMIPNRLRQSGLLIFMFLITVLGILIVSITITWTTINMSEKFFIEKFSIMNTKVMDKIQGNFESFDNAVVIASNNLLQSGTVKGILTSNQSDLEKMNAFYLLDKKMEYIKSILSPNQIGIFIMGTNGTVYVDDRSIWPIEDQALKNSILTKNTLKDPKKLIYQFNKHSTDNPFVNDNENYIVASRALMDRLSGNIYGTMYFALPESQFSSLYSSYTSMGNNILLVNKEGRIASSNVSNLVGFKNMNLLRYAKDMERHPQKYIIHRFMGKEKIMLVNYIPYFNMYLFNMIDEKEAIGTLIDKKAITLTVIGIVIVTLFIVFFATRRLTNSLTRLVKQIVNAPKSGFHQYVSINGTYETKQIGRAFNSMLDELHEYVDELLLAQKQQRNAELAALQQQINPHFLYNTLTSIKFMVHQGERDEIEETITAFISLLQNTIGNVSETVSVRQELNNLKNYVLINQKRYGDRITVSYFVAPDCLEYLVPKLILQPFVENSFFHGFNRKVEGAIHVLIWKDGEQLVCEVADNGDGMEVLPEGKLPNPKRKQQHFSGIGVKNVHERIQLLYGDHYGVSISSEPTKGTKVRISLPVNQN